jgi:hypothetical protein
MESLEDKLNRTSWSICDITLIRLSVGNLIADKWEPYGKYIDRKLADRIG